MDNFYPYKSQKQYEFMKNFYIPYCTMDIAEDKGMPVKRLATSQRQPVPYDKGQERYKRNYRNPRTHELHRKGSLKPTRYEYVSLYTLITDAWKKTADCLQTSAGLCHLTRECVYVDYDGDIEEWAERQKGLFMYLSPTYIIKNPKTGHGQAIWVLEYGLMKDVVLPINRVLDGITGGDMCCNHWQMKNPFSKKVDIIHDSGQIYSFQGLKLFLESYLKKELGITLDEAIEKYYGKKNKPKAAGAKASQANALQAKACPSKPGTSAPNADRASGRHDYFIREFPKMVWRDMDKGGSIERRAESLAELCDDMAAQSTGKAPQRHDDPKQYMADFKSAYRWAVENYKKMDCSESPYSEKDREVSLWIRSSKRWLDWRRLVHVQKLYKGKRTLKFYSEKTGMSISKIQRLVHMTSSEKELITKNMQSLKMYMENLAVHPSDKAVDTYKKVFEEEDTQTKFSYSIIYSYHSTTGKRPAIAAEIGAGPPGIQRNSG